MNRVILIGRLTRDPELRYTQNGLAVAQMSLAVDRRFRRDNATQTADFFTLVAWDKLAEICGNNLTKGRRIGVEGRLQSRSYEAKDGTKRYVVEVVIDNLEFLDSKNSDSRSNSTDDNFPSDADYQGAPPAQTSRSASSKPADFGGDMEDEDIPF